MGTMQKGPEAAASDPLIALIGMTASVLLGEGEEDVCHPGVVVVLETKDDAEVIEGDAAVVAHKQLKLEVLREVDIGIVKREHHMVGVCCMPVVVLGGIRLRPLPIVSPLLGPDAGIGQVQLEISAERLRLAAFIHDLIHPVPDKFVLAQLLVVEILPVVPVFQVEVIHMLLVQGHRIGRKLGLGVGDLVPVAEDAHFAMDRIGGQADLRSGQEQQG